MNAIEYANKLTNPDGIRPFCNIAIRWCAGTREWLAMNTIENGWSSSAPLAAKRLPDLLGRLDVTVVAIKCDAVSVYYLCEPAAKMDGIRFLDPAPHDD